MGSAVFRVRAGQQVVTQYNPIVKNPNTEGQQAQRAKFKLISQLAAIMAPAMGSFIIKTRAEKGKPSQRNMFTKNNLPLVEILNDNQEVTATIPMEQLQLTSSFRPLGHMELVIKEPSQLGVDFEQVPMDVTTIRVVQVRYPSNGTNSQAQLDQIVDIPVSEGMAHHTFTNLKATGEKVTVLAYGLIPSESVKASIDLDNIHTPADEDFISAVKLNAMVLAGQMSETVTVGANVSTIA